MNPDPSYQTTVSHEVELQQIKSISSSERNPVHVCISVSEAVF